MSLGQKLDAADLSTSAAHRAATWWKQTSLSLSRTKPE